MAHCNPTGAAVQDAALVNACEARAAVAVLRAALDLGVPPKAIVVLAPNVYQLHAIKQAATGAALPGGAELVYGDYERRDAHERVEALLPGAAKVRCCSHGADAATCAFTRCGVCRQRPSGGYIQRAQNQCEARHLSSWKS
jgi:hypothetical protein